MRLGAERVLAAALFAMAAVLALAAPAAAQSRFKPSLRFEVIHTPNFSIYFHQGEDEIARRLAVLAEQVHGRLTSKLETAPRGRTHVVLVDQNDEVNAWATTLPFNAIEIDVGWPAADDLLGNTDDWLRLVFTHEYTHVVHIDMSSGFPGVMRRVFGRSPLAFPNMYLPGWLVEGVATYEESALTGRGRLLSGSFQALVDEPLRRGQRLPIDRADRALLDWPAGTAPYAWGGFFVDYLAGRFGEEKVAALARETAGRFYYLSPPAFEKVFGVGLKELWCDFQHSRAEAASARAGEAPSKPGTRITSHGYVVTGPRIAGSDIFYSVVDVHGFPALWRVPLDGSADPEHVTDKYLGRGMGAAGGTLWFSEVNLEDSIALRSDLYAFDLSSGRKTRVTRGERYLDPDVSPDGRSIVAIRLSGAHRRLAFLDVSRDREPGAGQPGIISVTERSLVGDDDIEYSSPRWSPDGKMVAASRIRHDGRSEIVLVDASSLDAHVVVASASARNVSPAWTPGGRSLLFASDRAGGPLNLFSVELASELADGQGLGPVRQVTWEPGGAAEPEVSPDGRLIVYVGYTPDGYDLFTRPAGETGNPAPGAADSGAKVEDPGPGTGNGESGTGNRKTTTGDRGTTTGDRGTTGDGDSRTGDGSRIADKEPGIGGQRSRTGDAGSGTGDESSEIAARAYSPWPAVLPRYWLPLVEVESSLVRLGAFTSGTDVLGRHSWYADVSWRYARDGRGGLDGRPDWHASYVYDRWRPALFLDASDETDLFNPAGDGMSGNFMSRARTREAAAGIFVPFRSVRRAQAVEASFVVQDTTVSTLDGRQARRDRNSFRLAWSYDSAKFYRASISHEEGLRASITSEHVRGALGASGDADSFTAQVRGYLPLAPRHAVVAARAGAGVSYGDAVVRRRFYLDSTGPLAGLVDFGGGAFNLLRGFEDAGVAGSRVFSASLEYRVPLARIDRGLGPWPFFLRNLHAAAFVDAGAAWDGRLAEGDIRRSYGFELSLDVFLGYALPVTATAGIARPHDPSGLAPTATAYVRIGRAF